VVLPGINDGEQSELVCLNCAHAPRRNALAVYGLVPGSRLTLQQKQPAFVVRVGETELVLEEYIALEICVQRVKRDEARVRQEFASGQEYPLSKQSNSARLLRPGRKTSDGIG
jgi:Fe2+ transport system protein FeoA